MLVDVNQRQPIADCQKINITSKRIVELINNNDFSFSIETLQNIHIYLFHDIYDFAGQFRLCNLTKKEPIINNETVIYADYHEIKNLLVYDFSVEKKKNYQNLALDKKVKNLAKFISNIWQIHPFRDGNTRTIAVFMIKYLSMLGYDINNDNFKANFTYFRNALVLSNYYNQEKQISPNFEYLIEFYNNLLCNSNDIVDLENIKKKKLS
ncbi:MAG: hypothetical protein HFI87_05155 [Bacilli bacterium]|nr:hypothetical protein [Bacilli bacterium]